MTIRKPVGRFSILLAAALLFVQALPAFAEEAVQSLAGEWRFQLDAKDDGAKEKWFTRKLADTVKLPGTTDENGKGIRKDDRPTDMLARVWYWKGPAWYQRDMTIPPSWGGKRITLLFERSKNSRVWVDETLCGWENTLSAPQIFDVTGAMTPGKHTITVLIDNAKLPPVGPAHAVDERTQTNWNGIIGRMELHATDPVWIEDVQVYPNAAEKNARVRVVLGNTTGMPAFGKITVGCKSENVPASATFKGQSVEVAAPDRKNIIELVYQPGGDVPLWDEFQPALLRLDLKLEIKAGERSFADKHSVRFGMRDFTQEGNLLKMNGKRVFLRGRLDCANYPLTGYPPMDKEGWRRILSILKDWGLNHVRFHSWCPPAAAFYFQAELPNKRSAFKAGDDAEAAKWNIDHLDVNSSEAEVSLFDYGKREGDLIMRQFGNQPSFVMFTLGNELGRTEGMFELVDHFKTTDPRHLYAQGSNNVHWAPGLAEGDEFWVTGKVEKDARPIRGSFALADFPDAPIESLPPSTMFDFSKSISGVPVPMIGHETGQYQVSPA
jgi:beta-galactosidase/beta-glucuronidase